MKITRVTSSLLAAAIGLGVAGVSAQERATTLKRRPLPLHLAVVVECEALVDTAIVSAGPVDRQEMEPFGDGWGGAAQLFWRPPAPVEEPVRNYPNLRLRLTIGQAGTYRVTLVHTVAPDYGAVRVFVRGRPAGELNGYADKVEWRRFELGDFQLPAGTSELVFTVIGKDEAASDYFVGLDRLELRRVS